MSRYAVSFILSREEILPVSTTDHCRCEPWRLWRISRLPPRLGYWFLPSFFAAASSGAVRLGRVCSSSRQTRFRIFRDFAGAGGSGPRRASDADDGTGRGRHGDIDRCSQNVQTVSVAVDIRCSGSHHDGILQRRETFGPGLQELETALCGF